LALAKGFNASHPVLRIREILVRIRIRRSVPTDPDPDLAIFIINFKMPTEIKSHKTVPR